MRNSFKAAIVALALVGGALTAGSPAMAAGVTVGVTPGGGIAFGYSDGYWDQGHNWHAWKNRQEAARFRAENHGHYYAKRHDRDKNQGWRDSDHYWEHH